MSAARGRGGTEEYGTVAEGRGLLSGEKKSFYSGLQGWTFSSGNKLKATEFYSLWVNCRERELHLNTALQSYKIKIHEIFNDADWGVQR